MAEEKKTISESDIARLLQLKAFERPTDDRIEKSVQNTMRAVRSAHKTPSLLHFPDKSMAWMFAQPRYGIAALFIIFIGLALLEQPMPAAVSASSGLSEETVAGVEFQPLEQTNSVPEIPGMNPVAPALSLPPDFTAAIK